MPDHKIRLSQAITTFSPGAMVDLPGDSVIIGGLDGWQYDRNEPEPIISEPRLAQRISAILQTRSIILKRPPVSSDKDFGTTFSATDFLLGLWSSGPNHAATDSVGGD